MFQKSRRHCRGSNEKREVRILNILKAIIFSGQNDGLEYKEKLLEYLKKRSPFQNWSSVPVECPELMSTFEYVLVGSPDELNDKVILYYFV